MKSYPLLLLAIWIIVGNLTPTLLEDTDSNSVFKEDVKYTPITLYASKELSKIFPQLLNVESLTEGSIGDMFYRMNGDGNKVCNMLHKRYPVSLPTLNNFSPVLFNRYHGILQMLISGCHNFFKMNDIYITDVIDKINDRYRNEDKSCMSVGFSQVYLLGTQIQCKEITAIDVDWRILWAHYQFNQMFSQGKNIDYNLLNIGWSADYNGKINEIEPNIGIKTFCYKSDTDKCAKAFKDFKNKYSEFRKVEMQLAFLHQLRLKAFYSTIVIYVSNALDPEYTSKEHFNEFINNISDQINYNQKVVVIYHGGGNRQFGVYEIDKKHLGHVNVTTVCRDDFVWANYYATRGQRYNTYLDDISINQSSESCSK